MAAAAVRLMQVVVFVQDGNADHDEGGDGPRGGGDDHVRHGRLTCAV